MDELRKEIQELNAKITELLNATGARLDQKDALIADLVEGVTRLAKISTSQSNRLANHDQVLVAMQAEIAMLGKLAGLEPGNKTDVDPRLN